MIRPLWVKVATPLVVITCEVPCLAAEDAVSVLFVCHPLERTGCLEPMRPLKK